MKTVYGMAKCYLDLKGSRARNFELDFLRLALAAERDRNCVAVYLAAPLRNRDTLVSKWNIKYSGGKSVTFVCLNLNPSEIFELEKEKANQKESNRSEVDASTRAGARATYGEKLCEQKLADYVLEQHSKILKCEPNTARILPDIRWDYYGEIPD